MFTNNSCDSEDCDSLLSQAQLSQQVPSGMGYWKFSGEKCQVKKHVIQLNLNFTHVCRYKHAPAHSPRVKLFNLACTCIVACNFIVCTHATEHIQYTRKAHEDANHEITLGQLHYTFGVQIQQPQAMKCIYLAAYSFLIIKL